MVSSRPIAVLFALVTLSLIGAGSAPAQEVYQPRSGQAGKDVVWVPTPPELVEKMLDMAEVGPDDVVMDLGSGDGRNIIAAAQRGARSTGVEFNADMVELSRQRAQSAGVAAGATFVQGDMYQADISSASVLALFLLPQNLEKLQDKFLTLRPGSRIVLNTFKIEAWEPDQTEELSDCTTWCTAHLLIVPARVEGTWTADGAELSLSQKFQAVSGSLRVAGAVTHLSEGRLRGDQVRFVAGDTVYSGRVIGDRIDGTATTDNRQRTWTAMRAR